MLLFVELLLLVWALPGIYKHVALFVSILSPQKKFVLDEPRVSCIISIFYKKDFHVVFIIATRYYLLFTMSRKLKELELHFVQTHGHVLEIRSRRQKEREEFRMKN